MDYLRYLNRKSRIVLIILCFFSLVNSAWTSGLILIINQKIGNKGIITLDSGIPESTIYLTILIISFILNLKIQHKLLQLTYSLGSEIEIRIFNKLKDIEYEDYIQIGENKIRALITDISYLEKIPIAFVELMNALLLTSFCIGYLFFINFYLAAISFVIVITLIVCYYFRNKRIEKMIIHTRQSVDDYFANVEDFFKGYRELKADRKLMENLFYNCFSHNRSKISNITINTLYEYSKNELFGNFSFYFIVFIILYIVPFVLIIPSTVQSSFIFLLLFLLMPIRNIIIQMREFGFIKTCFKRVVEFESNLNLSTNDNRIGFVNFKSFEKLEFIDISYRYKSEEKQRIFQFGPVKTCILKGQCLFITGENGSGKSTFLNILSGLLKINSGQIKINDSTVSIEDFRIFCSQFISIIFVNNYIFEENYKNLDLTKENSKLMYWLKRMELDQIIQWENNVMKVGELSTGQYKRLALIYCLLENKEIIVLDEWTAEQDPNFRKKFYKEILPEIQFLQKTIILVTHDYNYYSENGLRITFHNGLIRDNKDKND